MSSEFKVNDAAHGPLTAEMLEKAMDDLMNMGGRPSCSLCGMFDGHEGRLDGHLIFLCVGCASVTKRHPHSGYNGRCYYCVAELLSRPLT